MYTHHPALATGRILLFGLLAVITAGCGPDYKKRSVVRGKVTLDGKALSIGSVVFHGPNNITGSANIDQDGYYTMSDAPQGEVRITVSVPKLPPGGVAHLKWAPKAPRPPGSPEPPAPETLPDRIVAIPVRYSKPESSPLTYTVEPGEHEYDIKLAK